MNSLDEDDLACARCGYLLRGLDPDGRCPECNLDISDSIEARALLPSRRVLRSLKCGAVALLVAVALYPMADRIAYADWLPRPGSLYLNRDGVRHGIAGLLFLPPAWWLARARPAEDGGPRWLAFGLALAVLVLAALMFWLIHGRTRLANAFLLPSYALAPLVEAIEIFVLIGALAATASRLVPGLRQWWVRAPGWVYGAVLLVAALPSAIVNVARTMLVYDLFTPQKDNYLPPGWNDALQPLWTFPYHTAWLIHIATVIGLAAYAVAIFRRGRLAPR